MKDTRAIPMVSRFGLTVLTLVLSAALCLAFITPEIGHAAGTVSACNRAIVHRGVHGSALDEETVASIERSSRWGFGGEADARVLLDGLGAVHDDRLTRITGGTDTRQPETMTLAELRAVSLEHGGHPASIRQLLRAAFRTGGKIIIEGKRFPQHEDAWRDYGLAMLARDIRETGMADRAWVGGTFGFTKAFHAIAPRLQTFWRVDGDEAATPANAAKRWATLVEAAALSWSATEVQALRNAGIIVATRNADTEAEWEQGYGAGIRTWQTNRPAALAAWCAAR